MNCKSTLLMKTTISCLLLKSSSGCRRNIIAWFFFLSHSLRTHWQLDVMLTLTQDIWRMTCFAFKKATETMIEQQLKICMHKIFQEWVWNNIITWDILPHKKTNLLVSLLFVNKNRDNVTVYAYIFIWQLQLYLFWVVLFKRQL